ncbi:BREX-1 system adenine-specific DNA-methyltransferase PglX [Anaerotignum sp. MSJ-24]|uniref:BREX-1 system adenine-specific DNA-methyltransferase PglX n=1 Tax=Anaerotignum sp. MSJ-24 TaxID=2841521 RepID=UPI001C122DCB|nr:BREX-1 system adenine-specific DNA-methyltransferase PglX [Anaerotignum sp. MSJ-24]MBU5465106.1 BREX-1 system adenine-specific DNA-methyltransferase PglX [Anaerotignum sp. MSJ-24]
MDKNAIKKFAVWARTELIARVSLKGVEYGITEDNMVDANADSVGGKVLTADKKAQRKALIAEINDKGYKQVMEEVAYTWFNRFSALRFMEVNGYLPSHVRVFTDEENNFKPQIITEAIHLDLDGLDMEKVYELKDAEKTEELYKYLLIVQCNALNKILPGMFQKIADYTELLLPDNLLREGSIIQQMIELIPEDDWKDAVQIIGWLYQFYNIDPKAAALSKKGKLNKDEIPAATQLFTPDWIVRYMVENSLGRLWLEGHPDVKEQLLPTEEEQSAYAAGNRDPEDTKWHYYLEEAEQEPEVQAQLAEIRKEYAALTPDQLKVIDPCSGSGHILAYMFDVLMKIYESYGYTTREAVASIVENNLYGLDIDDRVAQLAYFAVMMKARQYDRRFFSRGIQPHVYAIVESNHVDSFALEYFCNGDAKLKKTMDTIISELHDAKEYGSILTVTPQDWAALYARFAEIKEDIHISREAALRELLPLVQVAEALAQKYDVVVTNPPYLGSDAMGIMLSSYVKKKYSRCKADMFAVFIEHCGQMLKSYGYQAMITMQNWMFLSSFESLREYLVNNKIIINMCHLGARAFEEIGGEIVQTVAWVSKNGYLSYKGQYNRLVDFSSQDEKEAAFMSGDNRYIASQKNFTIIPGAPIAYWISTGFKKIFENGEQITQYVSSRDGLTTGNNELFIKQFWEVPYTHIKFACKDSETFWTSGKKFAPLIKGGLYRKWYGNNWFVITYDKAGYKKLSNCGNKLPSREIYFLPYITWNRISTRMAFRFCEQGYLFESASLVAYAANKDNLMYALAFANSVVARSEMQLINPTTNMLSGYVDSLRIPLQSAKERTIALAMECVDFAKDDWNSFETSWDFQHHPLLRKVSTIAKAFTQWQTECDDHFNQLKANEQELNRIFIDIYGLQNELTPEVEDKDVTVRKADIGRDIRSFISYAVGCMFGRYSLDVDGLAYAGGEWDNSKYTSFAADKDNIIPICDDEYFEDDIVGLFVKFVKTVYSEDTLDENLKFIADALGGKGQPKDVIRNYFLSDFYSDHCKIYQKRPIYWLFDSGKKNGFKALIYMHRYQPDTIARIRTDYVHEQQARYRTAIADLEQRIANASTGERVKLNKKLTTLQAQDTEIRAYEEKIHHLADQMISIDLDDGVKKNYAIFDTVLKKL